MNFMLTRTLKHIRLKINSKYAMKKKNLKKKRTYTALINHHCDLNTSVFKYQKGEYRSIFLRIISFQRNYIATDVELKSISKAICKAEKQKNY